MIAKIRRYLRVFRKLISLSYRADMEYRNNVIIRSFVDVAWYAAQMSAFEIIFRFTPTIGQWGRDEIRVYLFFLYTIDAIFMFFLYESIEAIPLKIRKGDLDMYLAKPMSSQFLLSFQKVSFAYFANLIFVFLGLAYFLWRQDQTQWHIRFLICLLLMPGAVGMYYFFRFMLASVCLFIIKSEGIISLWYQMYRLTFRPDDFYPQWFRVVLFSVIPVAYLVSYPTKIMLFDFDLIQVAIFYLIVITALWFSTLFWRWGLRKYASASS